jgi:hypothetical protein
VREGLWWRRPGGGSGHASLDDFIERLRPTWKCPDVRRSRGSACWSPVWRDYWRAKDLEAQ